MTVIDRILHALVTVRADNILHTLLTNARGVDTAYFKLKVHVSQRFARVCERDLLVAMLTMNDLDPPTVPTESLFHIAPLVRRLTSRTLSHIFTRAILTRDDIKGLAALALHTKLDEFGGDFNIPLKRVTHKPILNIIVDHCIQTSKCLFKGYHIVLHVQFKRNITINLHRRGNNMSIALCFTTRALLLYSHAIDPVLGGPAWIAFVKSFSQYLFFCTLFHLTL
jgi:hypothetical protein